MAKGQKRSNREKKKPKADKKKVAPTASPFASTGQRGKPSRSDLLKKRHPKCIPLGRNPARV